MYVTVCLFAKMFLVLFNANAKLDIVDLVELRRTVLVSEFETWLASIHSICGQYCFVLCGLISAAQRNEAEPDSNEE